MYKKKKMADVTIFKYKEIDFPFNYGEDFFNIVEYDDELDIKKYLVYKGTLFYMIWTKNKVMRLQICSKNFDKHDILNEDDDEYYLAGVAVKGLNIEERIESHMKQSDHSKCLIL